MNFILSTEQMKQAEKSATSHCSYLDLMIKVATASVKKLGEIVSELEDKGVTVLCGRGNNGGDGIAIAAAINNCGGTALVVFVDDLPKNPVARECYNMYEQNIQTVLYAHNEQGVKKVLESSDIIIDCVFGTGFSGELPPYLIALFDIVNATAAIKISIDIPSGCSSDYGDVAAGAFKPHYTFALGAKKIGMLSNPCFTQCGHTVVLDIGISDKDISFYEAMLTDKEIMKYLPSRPKNSNKGTFGTVLNITGCARFSGAALLSTKAALKIGAGLVVVATPKFTGRGMIGTVPEAIYVPLESDDEGYMDIGAIPKIEKELPKATVITLGCGLGVTADTRKIVEFVLKESRCPIILDADGINSIIGNINILQDNDMVITPHPGELSRLLGIPIAEIERDRIGTAKRFAKNYQVTILLKGVNTVIATKSGDTFVNTTGNSGLSKAGSGDVLTGIIGGLSAQGLNIEGASILGAYMHGKCADILAKKISLYGIMPSDIVETLPFISI